MTYKNVEDNREMCQNIANDIAISGSILPFDIWKQLFLVDSGFQFQTGYIVCVYYVNAYAHNNLSNVCPPPPRLSPTFYYKSQSIPPFPNVTIITI